MKTYLVIHACVWVYRLQGGGLSVRTRKGGEVGGALDLGWLGTMYRERTMPIYNYV
jgi:hypothetical protein